MYMGAQATLLFHSLLVSYRAFYLTVAQQLSMCDMTCICPIWVNLVPTTLPESVACFILDVFWCCYAFSLEDAKLKKSTPHVEQRSWKLGRSSVPQQPVTNPSQRCASLTG